MFLKHDVDNHIFQRKPLLYLIIENISKLYYYTHCRSIIKKLSFRYSGLQWWYVRQKGRAPIKLFTRNRAAAMADSEICITKMVSRPNRFFTSAKPRAISRHSRPTGSTNASSFWPGWKIAARKASIGTAPFSSTFASALPRFHFYDRAVKHTARDVSRDVRGKGFKTRIHQSILASRLAGKHSEEIIEEVFRKLWLAKSQKSWSARVLHDLDLLGNIFGKIFLRVWRTFICQENIFSVRA